MIKKINFLFVTLLGVGKIKKIPGSIASLLTVFFLYFLFHQIKIPANIFLFILIIIFLISLYSVNIYIEETKDKDPKEVVIDEFVGQSIPISLYELAHNIPKENEQVFKFYFIIFILFRIFDITKPYPANYYEKKFKNSFGVMMDDVCAGLYVVAVLILYMVISS
tara:strand:- start:33 stop:527 length:495 start_codon:yes stop_codon:yes gene_type:complete